MFGKHRWGLTLAVATAAILAPTAPRAVEITAGDWKFTASGNVNADYIISKCDDNPSVVAGGLACTATTGDRTSSSVSNGLLPAALAISASTTQGGYDIAANFGLFPGISTNDGGSPNLHGTVDPAGTNTALGTTGLDIRQVFLTFGNDRMGTILAGRNIGLFGQDAILGDMTLLGVGAGNGSNAAPTNTSLGSIGLGYIYTDWLAQINYTTPNLSGAKITVGIFDPLEPVGVTPTNKKAPGFHTKIAYTLGDLYLSATGLYQKQKSPVSSAFDFSSWAFDAGGKYKIAGFEVLAFYYNGRGVGTTGLFINAADPVTGHRRKSDGFLAQVTYTIDKTKLGVNYGQSKLDLAPGEINPTLVQKNSKYTVGVYQKLTDNLTLLAEGTDQKSKAQNGGENKELTFNVGAFLAF
jgi:predicted porin